MQRRSFDQAKELFLNALATSNWNDVAVFATEMLMIDDTHPWAWANRGVAYSNLGFPLDAILNYDRAIALDSASPIAYINKGAAYWDMEKVEAALSCYGEAIKRDPNISQTHMNVGHIKKWQGHDKQALECYRRAVELDPNYPDAQMALGMLLLKLEQFKEGWAHYEWRWKSNQATPRGLKQPQWDGKDLTNKNILIYGEQGLGDIIQFARYARILAQQFPRCRIIVEARHPVKRLLETVPEIYAVINYGDRVPEVDYVVPMITLAGMLTPNTGHIPSTDKEYLLRSTDVDNWSNRMANLPEGLRVGICWAGMARTAHPQALKVDQLRSGTLAMFAPLAQVPDVTFVSLQKGPPAMEVQRPPAGMTIGDYTEDMYDFYETCCAIENCDLVISVDTAVVHAAASIGKPTWLLSRWDGCWRWFGDRQDSPWYPSLRQFVQPQPHDWDGMMRKVALALAEVVETKNSGN